MEFYSHPGKLLKDHLGEVLKYSCRFGRKVDAELLCILGICHDFGKFTEYFQEHLKTGKEISYSDHSFISAVFGAYITMKNFKGDASLPLFVYQIILRHHGCEQNLDYKLYRTRDENWDINMKGFKKQLCNLRRHKDAIVEIYAGWGYGELAEAFILEDRSEEVFKQLEAVWKPIHVLGTLTEKDYFRYQILYSALIAADKFSASGTPLMEEKYVSFEMLNLARVKKLSAPAATDDKKEKINRMRTEIFEKVQARLNNCWRESRCFSITAPTGTGKTYCGFFAALKLRELFGGNRRIIYALPFTSIINQNYEDLENLVRTAEPEARNGISPFLMKHHSLANIDYESEHYDLNRAGAEMLIENWSSGVVVTTFVQLMETLISNRNRMLKKFHALRHSVILLDEVQAFPLELLKVIDFALEKASEELDCHIIMMTATKPVMLQKAIELLPDYEKYFRSFHRTRLCFKKEKMSIQELEDMVVENAAGKSCLVILNTIQSSLDLYSQLKNMDRKVFYLSANLLPVFRSERIEEIRVSLKKGEKPIVVSTQVVEAGIDFDFDCGIRDIAPLSSVIQAAGRINRHDLRERGTLQVVCLENGSGKLFGTMVYGDMHIDITAKLLGNQPEVNEEEYLEIIQEYFRMVNLCSNQDKAKGFIRSIKELVFAEKENAVGRFSLIEDKGGYLDVFLQVNDEAEKLYGDFQQMLKEKDSDRRRELQLKLKPEMAKYTLSIPQKFASRINHVKEEILWTLPREGCEEYYDPITGFKRDDGEEYFVF